MRQGPLARSYPGAVALVVCALVPFLLLTAAIFPLSGVISKSIGIDPKTLQLTVALSDGGYAFGTVLAVQFASHLRARRMLLVYVTLFVIASFLAAWAPAPGVFVGAFIVQGLCTSLMLIAAVPPLVVGWGAKRMPVTAGIMNLCIFGAVAVGPTIGGLLAGTSSWRPLFVGVAAVGALALVFALLTFRDDGPQDREAPWDLLALVLALGGCGASFFGAGDLIATLKASAVDLVPLVVGVSAIVLLVLHQFRARRPLMPVRQMATTFPVTGVVIALFTSAAAFGLMELVLSALRTLTSPTHAALLFIPEFLAAVATAGVFGLLFRTRFTPVLAFAGMLTLIVASGLALRVVTHGGDVVTAVCAGLVGLGVGASVSPALFLAGLSLRSAQIQRVFALVELLRGVTAFLAAPILLYLAAVLGATPAGGLAIGVWICLGLALAGILLALAVFTLGGGRLQVPDLDRWQDEGEPAWESPPLLARRRGEYGQGVRKVQPAEEGGEEQTVEPRAAAGGSG